MNLTSFLLLTKALARIGYRLRIVPVPPFA
jgi:hypothetical protein